MAYAFGVSILLWCVVATFAWLSVNMKTEHRWIKTLFFFVAMWLSLFSFPLAHEIVNQDVNIADKTALFNFFDWGYVIHMWILVFITLIILFLHGVETIKGMMLKRKIRRGEYIEQREER